MQVTKHHLALAVCVAALVCASVAEAQEEEAPPSYSVIDTLPLAGAVKWDYLTFDAVRHRLFIARGDSVDVLNADSREIVGSIPASGAHGVALAPDLGKGFISNGAANTVTVFNLATLQKTATISAGAKPDAIAYDSKTQSVFVANGESNDMTVINAKSGAVSGTIKLGGKPEFVVSDDAGHVYVNIEDKGELSVIETKKLKVTATYNLAGCTEPTGLAIDIEKHRLFSVCGNQVMIITQAENGKILDTLPIGAHSDAAIYDPDAELAFSSNGDGTLTVVGAASADHYKVLQTVQTQATARTMALDPATHTLYLAAGTIDAADPAATETGRPPIKPDSFTIISVAPDSEFE